MVLYSKMMMIIFPPKWQGLGMPPYIVWYIKPRAANLIEIKTCILLSFQKKQVEGGLFLMEVALSFYPKRMI